MTINVRIRDGMCPDPTTGEGGATEGDIRGSFSDIIDVIGVVDLANGHCLVTENSPAGLSVLVAPGIVYVPNADYDELDSNEPKFYEAIINAEGEVAITANTSGSTRIDLICVKVDKTITPDEHASNISTAVIVQGTPGAGAPTLPDNHAKLAEIEVADDAATIVNADITDSRVQAKINSDYIGASVSVTTKGDLQTHNGTTPARLPVGTDGQYPIADSSQTTGLKYKTPDGWNEAFETWEYVSVDDPTGIFKVNADVTTKYSAGMRIKMTNGGNTIYGIITVVNAYEADEAGYTYITFLHEIDPTDSLALYLMANSAITANYYSTQKAPFGFPLNTLSWTIVKTHAGYTEMISGISTSTWYNLGSHSITIPIGRWKITHRTGFTFSGSGVTYSRWGLSTANNNSPMEGFRTNLITSGQSSEINNFLTIGAKTTYYENVNIPVGTPTHLAFDNYSGYNNSVIRAVCAYL